MFIKKIHVELYRNFHATEINLQEGLNVLIGANNTGKSNLIRIINFLSGTPKLSIDDINKNELIINYKNYLENPPLVRIQYEIQHTIDLSVPDSAFEKLEKFLQYKNDGGLDEDNNIALLSAVLELRYELNPTFLSDYKVLMENITDYNTFIENLMSFSNEYYTNYFNVETNSIVESKYVSSIFEIESIDAERPTAKIEDVSRGFVRTKIEEVDTKQLSTEIRRNITSAFQGITKDINSQIREDQNEIGITNGKNEFISSFGFDGDYTTYFQYILKNTEEGYSLPVSHNGLGYNNLIYISNKIKQKKDNDYNVLLIEEPEAHLHPNMQYQLIKYIEGLKSIDKKGIQNQIIVTTHSPNISASTNFNHMILFNYEKAAGEIKNVKTIRFGDCFDYSKVQHFLNVNKNEGETDIQFDRFTRSVEQNLLHYREHLEKFLDITRSDMLFSSKVILVEGISEKLTIPLLAKLLGINLTDKHIVIEEVGGITFNNFLPIFLNQNKKALCLTDCDFKYVISEGKFNMMNDIDNYDEFVREKEKNFSNREFNNNEYFSFYTQSKKGSTFETELILENYDNDRNFGCLIEMANLPSGTTFLPDDTIDPKCGLSYYIVNKSIDDLKKNIDKITPSKTKGKVERILEIFYDDYFSEKLPEKKNEIERVFFTYLIYSYIKGRKGNFALHLASNPKIKMKPEKVEDQNESDIYLNVPSYIKEGLEWLLN